MNQARSTLPFGTPETSRQGAALDAGTFARPWRGGVRQSGGALRRFAGKTPHADLGLASLPAHSAPVLEGRTQFPSTVVDVDAASRVLVSGHNNPKLGRRVTRARWAGMPIFHLTLEERATCPPSCSLWRACYGNAMHMARRHRHGPALVRRLGADICALALENPDGFVVRLHTLGDFYSIEYAARWATWVGMHPELRVFGFTAHRADSPIGAFIAGVNAMHPDRWVVRFSTERPSGGGMEATTIWRQAEAPVVPEGIVCPAQTGSQDCCGSCGLCWADGARAKTIVFVGHGKSASRGPRQPRHQNQHREEEPMSKGWPAGMLERRLSHPAPDGWTQGQWETVCRTLAAGGSYIAAATAALLTKNQVIGVAHRRGMAAGAGSLGPRRRADAHEIPAGPQGAGENSPPASQAPMVEQQSACAPMEARYRTAHDSGSTAAREAVAGASRATPIDQLRRLREPAIGPRVRSCRWPIGEPGTEAFRFCDRADVVPDKPYCGEHCALAYAPRPGRIPSGRRAA